MSDIDARTLKSMHTMANGFAAERIDGVIDAIEEKMKSSDGKIIFSREQIKAELGKYLAIAYVKGYGDCHERKETRSLFL